MPRPEYPLLHDAVAFATKRHKGQDRDGAHPLPYISHPLDVLVRLRYVGGVTDEALLAAAALHDTLEETRTTLDDLREKFGARVADLVRQVTRREPTANERQGLSKDEIWELRSGMLLGEIERDMDAEAWQIKLADRLSNLSEAVMTRSKERLDRYLGQTERILAIIPRETNPRLWDALREATDRAKAEVAG